MSISVYFSFVVFFFFKQKTAYEMRISDWSSDVCCSDLLGYFNDLPEEQQIACLNATVDGLPDVEKDFGELIDRWAAGKPEQLAEKMNESLEITPELAQTLLFQRNANWAEQIRMMLDTPGTVFIAVGAGHLAGKKSVQDYLKALGIKAARVEQPE